MVKVETIKDGGITTRIKGDSDDIKLELAGAMARGVTVISDDTEEIEDNFVALVLTAMDMLQEKEGVSVNTENFKRMLDIKAKINIDEVVEAVQKLIKATNGEITDGK